MMASGMYERTPAIRAKQRAIMIGKKGAKAVAIVVFILGLWEFAQFGSMFVFEKRLPPTRWT